MPSASTAFGLIAAIPLLIIHAVLTNKTTAIVKSIEMSAAKFLNVMTLNREIEVGIAATAVTSHMTQTAVANGQAPVAAPEYANGANGAHGATMPNPQLG